MVKGMPELNLLPFGCRAPVNMRLKQALENATTLDSTYSSRGPGVVIVEDEKWAVPGDTHSRFPEHGKIHGFVSVNNSTFWMEIGSLDH